MKMGGFSWFGYRLAVKARNYAISDKSLRKEEHLTPGLLTYHFVFKRFPPHLFASSCEGQKLRCKQWIPPW